jgi:hypothetical protein
MCFWVIECLQLSTRVSLARLSPKRWNALEVLVKKRMPKHVFLGHRVPPTVDTRVPSENRSQKVERTRGYDREMYAGGSDFLRVKRKKGNEIYMPQTKYTITKIR